MVLLCPVACVMGPSKLSSVPLALHPVHQDTRRVTDFGWARKSTGRIPSGRCRRVPALSGAFGYAFQWRIWDLSVPVLVIGCDEVGVAEDSVLVDVEPVELLLGLNPDTDGGLERREDGERGDEDEGGVHYYAGDEAYHDRGPRRDEGAGRGDGDEGRYGAVAAHPNVYVAPVQIAHTHRAEYTSGCGKVRRQGDVGDLWRGSHRRSWVEAPPADPEYKDA